MVRKSSRQWPAALLAAVATTAAVVLATVLSAAPASAHEHPTKVELDAPAVVQVQTFGEVSISLVEHNRHGRHIGLVQRTYRVPLLSGSGFTVDPSGVVVTSPSVVNADLRRAETHAVNRIFHERYGDAVPMPADPYGRQTVPNVDPADSVNERLQRCYEPNTTDQTGGCVVFSNRLVTVLPFVTSQEKFGNLPAQVLAPAEGQSQDVAVLRVGGGSMPTVQLGTTDSDVQAFTALGFTGPPLDEASQGQLIGHFTEPGSGEVARDEDYPALAAGVAEGLEGGPVVGEQGQVVGFLQRDPDGGTLRYTGIDAVRSALDGLQLGSGRGPTDAVYESGMHDFTNDLFAEAIPDFEQTLELYPGHALAAEKLAISQDGVARGAGADPADVAAAGDEPGGAGASAAWYEAGWVLPAAGGVGLLALLVLVVLLVRRRGGDEEEDEGTAEQGNGPAAGVPPQQWTPVPGSSPPHGVASPLASWPEAGSGAGRPSTGSDPGGPGPLPSLGSPAMAGGGGHDGGASDPSGGAPSSAGSGARETVIKPGRVLAHSPEAAPTAPRAVPAADAAPAAGASSAAVTLCEQCRSPVPADHDFCGRCGHPRR